MTPEAMDMLDMMAAARARAVPAWTVRLEVGLTGTGRPTPDEERIESMVELMERTGGVRDAAVVPIQGGLDVVVGLSAQEGTGALERATALVSSCARYAGLGPVTVRRAGVSHEPDASRA